MSRHLDTILELQHALDLLKDADRRLHSIPDWMRELHEEHSASTGEIQALEEAVEAAGRERRTAETAIVDAQEKLKRYQQQINAVTTQREYGALLQEIDTVKAQIAGGEEAGLAALDRIEQAQQGLDARRQAFAELDERYAAELARWEGEKPGIARQVADLQERVRILREQLPKNLVAQFERILERHPSGAVAPIRRVDRGARGPQVAHCGACNYRVRPQIIVEIGNSGSLVQCDGCKRILYLETVTA